MYERHQVEKGFNSDVQIEGAQYHVQTEDWGYENPYLVSRVFKNGAVVKSLKIGYQDILPQGVLSTKQSVRLAMKVQHQQILDLLVSGQLI